ncbi:hypothetical protein B4135_1456 [Caldibacillus debilis]|uniref:Uncharacterized protein n=1 Tax=Caldibacillus debilis TaxID=301148 RepID=A0A150MCF4_9BACI|nr:hypothetical protein B4135_1456 [Caldibacillus debilis]
MPIIMLNIEQISPRFSGPKMLGNMERPVLTEPMNGVGK